jgi:hypothetical protein
MATASPAFGSDILLTSREVVLIGEVLRIEDTLRQNFMVDSTASQESVDIALEQLQGIVSRISSEDTLIWNFVEELSEWLRTETLKRTEFCRFNLETMLEEARAIKGSELTEAEVSQFVDFVDDLEQVRRGLDA